MMMNTLTTSRACSVRICSAAPITTGTLMHTKAAHSNTHQQLNTMCRRTRTQKWPRPFETHGISMSRVHMRDVATQSRMLQRLTSNSLRMQLPDLTVDVILARTSSLSCRLNVYTILARQTLHILMPLTVACEAGCVPAVAWLAAAVVAQGGSCQVQTGIVHSIGDAGAVVRLAGIEVCKRKQRCFCQCHYTHVCRMQMLCMPLLLC
jgi:hypothetical protein